MAKVSSVNGHVGVVARFPVCCYSLAASVKTGVIITTTAVFIGRLIEEF